MEEAQWSSGPTCPSVICTPPLHTSWPLSSDCWWWWWWWQERWWWWLHQQARPCWNGQGIWVPVLSWRGAVWGPKSLASSALGTPWSVCGDRACWHSRGQAASVLYKQRCPQAREGGGPVGKAHVAWVPQGPPRSSRAGHGQGGNGRWTQLQGDSRPRRLEEVDHSGDPFHWHPDRKCPALVCLRQFPETFPVRVHQGPCL